MELWIPMTKLGRYEIGALLGEGGAGRVYLSALHGPGFSRPVALKVLTGGGRLLEREARLGGLLRHPNLVDVFEIGEDQGVWYCALEYCAGGSLDERLPLPPRAVVELIHKWDHGIRPSNAAAQDMSRWDHVGFKVLDFDV